MLYARSGDIARTLAHDGFESNREPVVAAWLSLDK